ncbi:hypothetical protein V8E54_004459 [Elaphomyces granulatus]
MNNPDHRGTIDIVWSCFLVILTAVWTVIHLNIPVPDDGFVIIVLRKMHWVVLAVIAPDLLTMHSAMHLGYTSWTMEHAFYANSGGFVLESPEMRPFPITAASISYLVSSGYIKCPAISKEEIWDKSKADKFAKAAALVQGIWLAVQSLARAVQGLSIIRVPTALHLSHGTIATVLIEAGEIAAEPFRDTPLDFIHEKPLQIYKRRHLLQRFDLPDRPLQRLPNDTIMPLNWAGFVWGLVCIPSMVHSVIHLIAWNYEFPTHIEQLFWRGSGVILATGFMLSLGGRFLLNTCGCRGTSTLIWIWVRGIFVPSWMVLARLHIISEAVFSLRSLPKDVYQTIDWTLYIPIYS